MSHQAPALICSSCIKDLQKASNFRKKCIESANHFKKHLLSFEPFIWNDELRILSSGYNSYKNHKSIKDEPHDYNVNLFEDITAIIEENCASDMQLSSSSKADKLINEYNKAECLDMKRHVKKNIEYENLDLGSESSETQCHLCFKSFTRKQSLNDHMRVVHQKLNESDMFKCKYCDRLFKMQYYLSEFWGILTIFKNFEIYAFENSKILNF